MPIHLRKIIKKMEEPRMPDIVFSDSDGDTELQERQEAEDKEEEKKLMPTNRVSSF